MAEYIEREAALQFVFDACAECMDACEEFDGIYADCNQCMLEGVKLKLRDLPAADVVSRGAYDQTDWERCVALTQLKEIGKGLGERMDDVRHVVLCRDCEQYGGRPWENNESGICARTDCGVGEFDFCSYGEKKEES